MLFQDLYCVRSDLGNLLKALGRLDEAKVSAFHSFCLLTGIIGGSGLCKFFDSYDFVCFCNNFYYFLFCVNGR